MTFRETRTEFTTPDGVRLVAKPVFEGIGDAWVHPCTGCYGAVDDGAPCMALPDCTVCRAANQQIIWVKAE